MLPALKQIDQRCADLVQELVELWEKPPVSKTSFNIKKFKEYLKNHPNGEIEIHYIEKGYPLWLADRDTTKLSKKVSNIVRDKRDFVAMIERILKEAKKRYIIGTQKQSCYQLNLLCVPKKNSDTGLMTEIRVARHGSFSTRDSIPINVNIDKERCKIPTLPNIRKYVQLLINYKYVSLRDLKDAFRQLLLHKDDVGFIQYCIFGLPFTDLRQAYGVASAAANCQHFSQILIWIFQTQYLYEAQRDRVLVHIDDFILAANSEIEACQMANDFDKMCDELNVNISHEKDETAISEGVVHGLGFDLIDKLIYIPTIKFEEIVNALKLLITHRKATGVALESITGKMMHWAQLRKQAKVLCFRILRKIHDEIRSDKRKRMQIFTLSDEIILDFKFWLKYAMLMRTVTMKSILEQPSISITGATDASNEGGGFIVGAHFGAYSFTDKMNKYNINHRQMHINLQEAHAIVMLLHNYRHELTGRQLLLYIDNTSVMYSIYREWSGSVKLMEYVHEISLLMCIYRIGLYVEYIPTDDNGLADSLSRDDWDRFWEIIDLYKFDVDEKPTDLQYYPYLTLLREGVELP